MRRPIRLTAGLLAPFLGLGALSALPAGAATNSVASATAAGGGTWAVDATGQVEARGGAPVLGSLPANAGRRIVGMASTASGRGYWLASAQGGVFTFGDARYLGSMAGRALPRPIARIGRTEQGYRLVSATGTAYAFGATSLAAAPAPGARQAWLWPFSSTSPWNMPIGSAARYAGDADPRTTAITRTPAAAWVNAGEWSHPIVAASTADPVVTVTQPWGDPARLHVPTAAVAATGADGHLHVVDPSRQWIDEMFAAHRTGTGVTAAYHVRTDLNGPGVGHGGVRAYGGSAVGGLIRSWEVEQHSIRHALALSLVNDQLRTGWVWPASAQDSNGASTYGGSVPMGSLLAIPPAVDLGHLGLSPDGLVLARALRDYGAYVVDRGGADAFYAEPGLEPTAALAHLRGDVTKLRSLLRVVANNGPSSVGGGGDRRAPLAPAL